MTGKDASDLDSIVLELTTQNQPITIAALGGIDSFEAEYASSALFPYIASAIVVEWHSLTDDEKTQARQLLDLAIRTTPSGLALSDMCRVVVPAATSLGLVQSIKAALRDRARQRDDQTTASMASVALRWLTNLAVVDDFARGALVDTLSEVSLNSAEPQPFPVVAAQVASVTYDMWRDPVATGCMSRLIDFDSRNPDAWFALGQARLVDALAAPKREACLQGLTMTLECFDFAAENGGQRPDAVMYANSVRFILGWATSAPAAMLADYYQRARQALRQYLTLGYGLPEQSEWTRPRYAAETAWMGLIAAMERVAEPASGESPWYDAGIAIGALADVYRIANSFSPARSTATSTADALADLIEPQLVAPFVENVERFAYLSRWLRESSIAGAEEFAMFVRERAEQVVLPKVRTPGRIRR